MQETTDQDDQRGAKIGLGLVFGAGAGLALGSAFDNTSMGMIVGGGIGLLVGIVLSGLGRTSA